MESFWLMDNSGIFVITIILLILLAAVLVPFHNYEKDRRCKKCSAKITGCLIFGGFLRAFIETFLELTFASIINIIKVRKALT